MTAHDLSEAVATPQRTEGRRWPLLVAAAAVPLLLLGVLVALFFLGGDRLVGPSAIPVERLSIQRVGFRSNEIFVEVLNSGPRQLTIAQVQVNISLVDFSVSPSATIPRLRRARISIPYHWTEGEPYRFKLMTTNSLIFEKKVEVARETPQPTWQAFGFFALLGIYVGVIPVYLGLLWLPFLRRLGERWFDFLLSLTAGLLVFLGVDALKEAFEVAARVPGPLRGVALITGGLAGSFLALVAVGRLTMGATDEAADRLTLAYFIAAGIGLHNLGEGLAIGAAYVLGEVALGAFLVLGFMVHNTTEGLAIVSPIAHDRTRLRHLALLGLVAGAPTILGTWIGGFTYSEPGAVLFLSIGAGAVFQVVYEIVRFRARGGEVLGALAAPRNFFGLLAGFLLMYLTGLLVAV